MKELIKRNGYCFVLLSLVITLAQSSALAVKWPQGSDAQIAQKYIDFLDRHAKKHCPASEPEKIRKLYKAYRSAGRYLPYLSEAKLDKNTIQQNLPMLEEKIKWIESLQSDLKKSKSYPSIKDARHLEKILSELLILKRQHASTSKAQTKKKFKAQSKKKMREFEKAYDQFVAKIPFLLSFRYPVNHLENRRAYEEAAAKGETAAKNDLYFKRRILENGALRPGGRLTDIFERSAMDTIKVRLGQKSSFLPDDIRYDLEWLLERISGVLKGGKSQMVQRLAEWENMTRSDLQFYQSLLGTEVNRKPSGVAQAHALASKSLAEYIRAKQAAIYAALASEPEWIQALFALDQVLLNEVGRATSENYRDRRDVAQVVINRFRHKKYSTIANNEALFPYLKKVDLPKGKSVSDFPWLNVLYKDGEFSFTHYFIPAVEHSICPDFYHVAKDTRHKNALLTIDMIKKPNTGFPALRYYSRFSMVGKIDMASLWPAYKALPEQPGRELNNDKFLKQAVAKDQYRYFYDFRDAAGSRFDVIEVRGEAYAVKNLFGKAIFYHYRDPNKFRFFAPK